MLELLLTVFLFFNLVYIVAVIKKDFSVIDIAWGPSFVLIFSVGMIQYGQTARSYLLLVLLLLWMFRLSGYILYRSMKLKKEDYRYTQMRKKWGRKANLHAYFKVFLLQATLSLIIGIPLYQYSKSPDLMPLGTWLDWIGILLWIVGMFFETVSDFQKNKFKSKPGNEGKVIMSGLWKYSRHPNYFGESLLWFGFFFLLLNNLAIYIALIAPIMITFLLIKVSGVSMIEQKYFGNAAYDEYKRKTNAFIPWFPKDQHAQK